MAASTPAGSVVMARAGARDASPCSASVMARSRATSRISTARGNANAATKTVVTASVTRKSRRRTADYPPEESSLMPTPRTVCR